MFSLDYLRGFAAISVSLFHFTDKLDYLPDNNFLKILFSPGHYGVEVFFIISGLVIPYSMEKGNYALHKFVTFMKKRIIRIEPPYLICVLLALLLNYLTTLSPVYVGKPFSVDFQQLFYHIGYLNAFMEKDWLNQVFWTLAIEFQYYLLIALIFPLISSEKRYIWIPTLVLFNVISFYSDRNFIFNFSIFFTTGILLYRYLLEKNTLYDYIVLGITVLSFLFLRYSYIEIMVVLLTSIVILLPLRPTLFSSFFGNISYSLYLLHFIIGLRVINLTQRFTHTETLRELMVLGALIFTVIISYLYFRLIEKPCKEISQKIKYNEEPVLVLEKEVVGKGY